MSRKHLEHLKTILLEQGWQVRRVLSGNGYQISETWHLLHQESQKSLHLQFEGLDEFISVNVEETELCRIKEKPKRTLSFGRFSRRFKQQTQDFVSEMSTR